MRQPPRRLHWREARDVYICGPPPLAFFFPGFTALGQSLATHDGVSLVRALSVFRKTHGFFFIP